MNVVKLYSKPMQLAFGGLEAAVHVSTAAQLLFGLELDLCYLKVDMSNAFSERNCSFFLT